MVILRLFHQNAPSQQIEARTLEEGELNVGREPGVGWRIDDPDRAISRTHCVLSLRGDQLVIRDVSSNGVYLGAERHRLVRDQATPLQVGETVRFGQFILLVEQGDARQAPERRETRGRAASPFSAPQGMTPVAAASRASANPFASTIPDDPLAFGRAAAREPMPSFTEDAWSRAETRRAGDWGGPDKRNQGHENLIGSERTWTAPPAAPAQEAGFGFDAPFTRPMLKTVEISHDEVAIPSDWDASDEPPSRAPPGQPPAGPFQGPSHQGASGQGSFGQGSFGQGSFGQGPPGQAPHGPAQSGHGFAPQTTLAPSFAAPPHHSVAQQTIPPQAFSMAGGASAHAPLQPPQGAFAPDPFQQTQGGLYPGQPVHGQPIQGQPAQDPQMHAPFAPGQAAPSPFQPQQAQPQQRQPVAFQPGPTPQASPGPAAAFQAPQGYLPQAVAPQAIAPVPNPGVPAGPPSSAPSAAHADLSLLLAFCEGAKLDPSAFATEDPVEMMKKLGAVYQQMVLGLGDLISERTTVKNEYRMVRTSVRAEGNNPFKWAPPQRVAVDLLQGCDDGFLSGPAAVKDSFEDLKKHLICMLAGLRASVASTLETLSPERVEGQLKGQSLMMKNKGAVAWGEYVKAYADFRKQADDNPDSLINREFRAAYERQLAELDGAKSR